EDEAAALGAPTLRIQTYLANTMEANGGLLPYSTVTAVEEHGLEPAAAAAAAAQSRTTKTAGGGPFPPLRLVDGSPAPVLAADEILLNEWAAKDLEIGAGDSLRMSYYVVGAHEELRTDATEFRVAGVLSIAGLAADPALTPDYPGIQDADDISQWDPPFPVDLDLVRPVDEAYWDDYRATPKAFVSPQTAQRLWSTRYGSTTSVRLGVPARMEPQEFRAAFGSGLLETINLPLFGFRFLHVKEDGLSAAAGATDFSGLFIGFSFFLIISDALLVGLLFSLGVEQRASEVGLRLSVGYPVAKVRRQMLAEGGLLAAGGAVVGLLGGVAYGWLLMVGLRTLWLPAVGSPLLFLHVEPVSLIIGWLSSVAVVLVSIWWTVRRLGRVPTPSLLAGSFFSALAGGAGGRRLRRLLAFSSGGLALALFLFAAITGTATSPAIAMGIGSLLLIAGLSCFAIWCRGAHGMLPPAGWAARIGMAARNSAWSPGRSILSVALVASACFVIVAVAANHRNPASESQTTESGGGGYDLIATSDVPLLEDLNKRESLFDLGFADSEANVLADVQITALRRLPGDDASCLNLYRPQRPIILGVPHSQVERGGFAFASLIEETEDPWQLLEVEMEPGVVPAFGDANSVQWILHLGLGKDLQMEDEFGRSLRLRLVGLLAESIFQSQLLISEGNFLRHFPNQGGYSTFLIDATEGKVDRVAQLLEANLTQFGFDTTSTEEKVAGFLAVQNTYLSTFQMLGGLGLLLGTFGLAFVMMRNVIERRGELATLRAFGFRRSSLTTMVLAENLFLLLTGAVIGSLSALAAVAPRFLAGALQLPWSSLLATLILMLLAGLLSSIAAVGVALRAPLLPVLKAER
ncbi:MAG: FtsX-like permease family protein, partial [Acidobacteriota bacterium]